MVAAILVMVLASSMAVLRPALAAWSSARRRREVFSSAACLARREWHSWRVLLAASLAVVASLRVTVAALVAGTTSTAWFAKAAALMRGPSRGGEAGGGPEGGGEAAAGWVDGHGSSPVEGEPAKGAASEWGDDCLRRLVAVESGVRAGWVLFLMRVAVRGLGRGETAGVGLDGPADVSSGGALAGMDSVSRTVSSSSTMTCG